MVRRIAQFVKNTMRCLLVVGFMTAFLSQSFAGETVIVKALGRADVNVSNAESMALDDAMQKAIKKAVFRVVSQNNGQSVGDCVVNNYRNYIVGKVKVTRKNTVNGKLVLACDVPVDYEKVVEDIHSVIAQGQNQHLDETVVFFVRFSGAETDLKNANYADDAFSKYNAAFRVYGFQVEEIETTEYNNSQYSFDVLKQRILSEVQGHKSNAKYVVISDIVLRNAQQNKEMAYAEVAIKSEAYVLDNNQYIAFGEFSNIFSGTRKVVEHAVDYASQRAVVGSAKTLADLTYQNWQLPKK